MSSSDELSLFSYEILGLVGREGAGAHDLLTMARRGRLLAWAGESQYYSEPKRLAKLGYLDAHKAPGRTRERTVYTITDQGLRALRDWAKTPLGVTPLKSEALVRLLVADLVGEKATRTAFGTLRDDIDELRDRLEESETSADQLPHRRRYLLLVTDFLERLLELHEGLADEVDRELRRGGASKASRPGR
jgi:DNA-binding PadR family transcriptional regulator